MQVKLQKMLNLVSCTSTWPAWKRSKAPSIYTTRAFGPGACGRYTTNGYTDKAPGHSIFYVINI